MFKKWVKSLSLVIITLLILSIVPGCASKDKDETKDKDGINDKETANLSETSTGEDAGRQMEGNLYLEGTPIVKDKETFTIMISYGTGKEDTNELLLYKNREEKTNINIQYDYVMPTALNERKATMFATEDFPDAMVNILTTDEVVRYSETGALLAVDEYINEKYMPRLKKLIEEYPDVKRMSTMPDGKIYGFPRLNFWSVWPGGDTYINNSWIINKEWLDTLGLKKPTTTEELKFVLSEFKMKDPNGNNEPDEIPYSFCYNNSRSFGEPMFGPFGIIGPGKKVNVQNGKVFFAAMDPRYKKVVKYVRDLYTNGLIDKEAFSQTKEEYRSKGTQADPPIYGMANGWMGDTEVGPRIRTPDNPDQPYEPLEPVAGPDGTRLWDNQIEGIVPHLFIISNKCESPEILARYVDELYDEDESVQECWGAFGDWVEKRDDGTYVRKKTPEGQLTDEWLYVSTSRIMPYALTDATVEKMRIELEDGEVVGKEMENKYIYASVYAPFAVKECYPRVVRTEEEVDEIGRLLPQIENLIAKKEVEWMTGVADMDAEYDAFIEELKTYKIERVTELYQAAYDRYMGN